MRARKQLETKAFKCCKKHTIELGLLEYFWFDIIKNIYSKNDIFEEDFRKSLKEMLGIIPFMIQYQSPEDVSTIIDCLIYKSSSCFHLEVLSLI